MFTERVRGENVKIGEGFFKSVHPQTLIITIFFKWVKALKAFLLSNRKKKKKILFFNYLYGVHVHTLHPTPRFYSAKFRYNQAPCRLKAFLKVKAFFTKKSQKKSKSERSDNGRSEKFFKSV